MNKKNIDKLFQEKLKDFREIPDEKVWKSIESSLDRRKKSKRVIPIWWKLGGAAALLAIGLFIINPFSSSEPSETIVTDVEKTEPSIDSESNSPDPLNPQSEIELPVDEISSSDKEEAPEKSDAEDRMESAIDDTNLAGVDKPDADPVATRNEKNAEQPDKSVLANAEKSEEKDPSYRGDISVQPDERTVESDAREKKEMVLTAEEAAVAAEDTNLKENLSDDVLDQSTKEEIAREEVPEEKLEDDGKKSIFDEIEKQQQEEEALAEISSKKWSVGPSVAPVYFSSFGEGSPIHTNFASNSKSGNVNLSYGVALNYELNKKLSIRSGIHKVDYGYDTNDITFSSSLVASTSSVITNINYTNSSRNLVVESSSSREVVEEAVANDIVAQSPSRSGRMVQEFGYVEVPVELNYSLIDKKLNVNFIGGFSSLFLVDNSVLLESEGTTTEMGQANNLNNVNFSTNLGLGINYELNSNMKVHLEPMFKYQLNMFSDIEGNFRPYTLGIYTGMSFKF